MKKTGALFCAAVMLVLSGCSVSSAEKSSSAELCDVPLLVKTTLAEMLPEDESINTSDGFPIELVDAKGDGYKEIDFEEDAAAEAKNGYKYNLNVRANAEKFVEIANDAELYGVAMGRDMLSEYDPVNIAYKNAETELKPGFKLAKVSLEPKSESADRPASSLTICLKSESEGYAVLEYMAEDSGEYSAVDYVYEIRDAEELEALYNDWLPEASEELNVGYENGVNQDITILS